MEKVKDSSTANLAPQKPEEFKESFLKIVKMLNIFAPEELDRIVKACEEQGNYTGLINQSFGAMAKRMKQMHEKQDELFGTALPILTGMASNHDLTNNEAIADEAIKLAKVFLEKIKSEEIETKK